MNPRSQAQRVGRNPLRACAAALALTLALAWGGADAGAQNKNKRSGKGKKPNDSPAQSGGKGGKKAKPPTLDFSGLSLEGRLRTPQLLYFLDRASAELQAASLERRSFIPEMVRSLDEEAL